MSEKRFRYPLRHALISALFDVDVKGVRWLAHRLPGWLLPQPEGPLLMQTRYGFWMKIDPVSDRGVERSIYDTGTYERGTLAVMNQLLRPGDTFVDVGANIGLMTLFASCRVGDRGRVHAFEPAPGTADLLRANIRLNRCLNVNVAEMAVGSSEGTARIFPGEDHNRGAATLVGHAGPPPGEGHSVPVTTLSGMFGAGERVDLVKLDVEGYELEALKGATALLEREDPPAWIVECSEMRAHAGDGSREELYRFLARTGIYRIFRGSKGKERTSRLVEIRSEKNLPDHDNLICLTRKQIDRLPHRLFKIRP